MDRHAKKGKCSNCKVCKAYLRETGGSQLRHVLSIRWQPDSGRADASRMGTAPAESEIRSAVAALETVLVTRGIRVVLEIFPPTAAGPLRETVSVAGIWIDAHALEHWLKPENLKNDWAAKMMDEIFTKGEKPGLTPTAERVVTAGLLAAAKLLQTKDGLSGCPTHQTPQ